MKSDDFTLMKSRLSLHVFRNVLFFPQLEFSLINANSSVFLSLSHVVFLSTCLLLPLIVDVVAYFIRPIHLSGTRFFFSVSRIGFARTTLRVSLFTSSFSFIMNLPVTAAPSLQHVFRTLIS